MECPRCKIIVLKAVCPKCGRKVPTKITPRRGYSSGSDYDDDSASNFFNSSESISDSDDD